MLGKRPLYAISLVLHRAPCRSVTAAPSSPLLYSPSSLDHQASSFTYPSSFGSAICTSPVHNIPHMSRARSWPQTSSNSPYGTAALRHRYGARRYVQFKAIPLAFELPVLGSAGVRLVSTSSKYVVILPRTRSRFCCRRRLLVHCMFACERIVGETIVTFPARRLFFDRNCLVCGHPGRPCALRVQSNQPPVAGSSAGISPS